MRRWPWVVATLGLPQRRLVVIGPPGAGKTSLAVLLTLELCRRYEQAGGPVPVLLSPGSWNPAGERMHAWIERELNTLYPALRAADYGPRPPTSTASAPATSPGGGSTRSWLALRGRLPWRLMSFLDDAHRLGVLRQVGPFYQFRHAGLQDRLARTVVPAVRPPPNPPPQGGREINRAPSS